MPTDKELLDALIIDCENMLYAAEEADLQRLGEKIEAIKIRLSMIELAKKLRAEAGIS